MSLITFDITYKNKSEANAFKLPADSEFQQLKLMICGKYRLYETNKVQIYYRNDLLACDDKLKLRELFKFRKIKLDIFTDDENPKSTNSLKQDKLQASSEKVPADANFSYLCKCKSPASYICDRCNEFVCEACFKKRKHITHIKQLIKLGDYTNYIKDSLRSTATELDEKITNDETYQFFSYWDYDLNNEIKTINFAYENLKSQLEDMKQLQIDYIITLSRSDKFKVLKSQIDDVIKDYASMDLTESFDKILVKKKKILHDSKEILDKYEELKNNLIAYTNVVKEIQQFNNGLTGELKKKFVTVKKKYYIPKTEAANQNGNCSNGNPGENLKEDEKKNPLINTKTGNSSICSLNEKMNSGLKTIPNEISNSQTKLNQILTLDPTVPVNQNCFSQSKLLNNKFQTYNKISTINSPSSFRDKCLFKLKNDRRMIIFSTISQTFKEKEFLDNSNFRVNMTNEADITQLNLNNKLFLLSGKKYNKFFYYDYQSNSINFISTTLYPHYYGSMIYCNQNNSIYLLGGNNQIKCEKYALDSSNNRNEWENVPSLCEQRQEFAAMYFKGFIYVFFGFSPSKGINLSSIERLNIETEDKFEIIYINEQITLSSLACAKFIDDDDENEKELRDTDELLLLGGFDGKNYLDSSLIFNFKDMKLRDCDIVIPNMNKHSQFLFHKECTFIEIDGNNQISFDMKNNVHLISRESYELFSEAPSEKK